VIGVNGTTEINMLKNFIKLLMRKKLGVISHYIIIWFGGL
jgi:hypothetical protein